MEINWHHIEGVACEEGGPAVAPRETCRGWIAWHRARKVGGKIDWHDLDALEEEWS